MIIDILAGALGAMTKGPRSLKTALALSTQLNSDAVADADLDAYEVTALFSHLKSTEPSDAAFSLFLITLAAWDILLMRFLGPMAHGAIRRTGAF